MKNLPYPRILLCWILLLAAIPAVTGQKPMFNYNQTSRWNPVFPMDLDKSLFRSTLDVMDHHMTGLMLIKRTSDSSYRVNFSNEVGMTYFDLEFTDGRMKVISVFPDMDRKSLLSILEKDFRLLLFRDRTITGMTTEDKCSTDSLIIYHVNSSWGKYVYTVECEVMKLKGIVSAAGGYKKTLMEFRYKSEAIPVKVVVKNPAIRLTLELVFITS